MDELVLKHEAPRFCRIRRALFGASPSAIFGRCTFGLRHGCRACKGCEHNVAEAWLEGFEESAKKIQASAQEKPKEMEVLDLEKVLSDAVLGVMPDEEAEPPEPTTMTPAQRTEALTEVFERAVQVYAEAARVFHEWLANFTQAMAPAVERFVETLREALENAAKKPPRVNKRPDYNQKAKACTKGKIKRIRTQRSREPK